MYCVIVEGTSCRRSKLH